MKIIAKSLVFDAQRNILLLRRSLSHPHFAHHFDFPGGEVESTEDDFTAVIRELKEETGLVVKQSDLEVAFKKRITNDLVYELLITQLNTLKPDISTSWEHDNYRWVSRNALLELQIPDDVDSYYLDVLRWLKKSQ